MRFFAVQGLLLLWPGLGPLIAPPANQDAKASDDSATDLVRQASDAQLKNDRATDRFRYRERRIQSKGSQTYEIVESDGGPVERTVEVNDQPLSDRQEKNEHDHLAKLLVHPDLMRKVQEDDRQEMAREERIISALPKAFLYNLEAMEDKGRRVRIHFRPNPEFTPSSREAQICRALEGTMWIDREQHMFVKAEGKLTRDVNFGWGFLAHLHSGGYFSLEQSQVNPGVWRITIMDVKLTGKKLLFGPLNIAINSQFFAFQRVPDHLTLQEAVDILSSIPPDGEPRHGK
jgi:hypothetical protein